MTRDPSPDIRANMTGEYPDPLAVGSLLSIREAARLVGCKPAALYEARRLGTLATYELGERRVLVSRTDLAGWLASRRRPARQSDRQIDPIRSPRSC